MSDNQPVYDQALDEQVACEPDYDPDYDYDLED